MQKDERDLLEVLRSELNFLEKDGYGHSARESWRPAFIFEDSPTCMNYDCKTNPAPCSDCVLMQLVPPEFRLGKTPCRRITLNAAGETLDSLYRSGDQHEIEETLRKWLEATITELEGRHQDSRTVGCAHSPASGETMKGIAMHENVHPKCANPACSTRFRWLLGGKFFRFRPDHASPDSSLRVSGPPNNLHGVEHFWLCDYCSRIFTVVYDAQSGVVLRLL